MKKKKLFIILSFLLIVAIIFVIFYTKNDEISVEELISDEIWEGKQEELKVKSEHNWKISENGEITCLHCSKSYEIGDIIDYIPEGNGAKILLSKDLTGYTEDQLVTRENATWVVFGATDDGKGLLITTEIPLNQDETISFKGAQAYNMGVEILNAVARALYSNSKYGYARSMTIEDVNNYLEFENLSAQYTYLEETDSTIADDDNYEPGGTWAVLDNLNTKIKELPTFKDIIKGGTFTPDGINTEEALGEYCVNSYVLQAAEGITNGKCIVKVFGSNKTFEIDAEKKDFIFGVTERTSYTYWLASQGISASNHFVAFGLSMIQAHSVTSCIEMYDSRGENGLYFTENLTPGIRPVVELYVVN